jgi:hypothetical protein
MQRISFCVKRSLAAEYSNCNFEYDDLTPIAIIGEENEGVGGISFFAGARVVLRERGNLKQNTLAKSGISS